MLLKKFVAKNVHGFLDFNITFDKKITFITSQNGGGKTTLVNAIVALISPNLDVLANIEFDHMALTLTHENKTYVVNAERDQSQLVLSTTESDTKFNVPLFTPDTDEPTFKQAELERDHYREFQASNAGNEVLKVIAKLPVPMFLDIDRRSRANIERQRPAYFPNRFRAKVRNVFSAFLSQSLNEAALLVEERYRQFLIVDRTNAEKLRQDLVLSLFNLEENREDFEIHLPNNSDKQLIESMRELQRTLPELLSIDAILIKSKIAPYLAKVEKLVKKIPETLSLDDMKRNETRFQKHFPNIMNWMAYLPTLHRFSKTIELVQAYSLQRDDARRSFDRFVALANKFLLSGSKQLEIDKQGSIVFRIIGRDEARPITTLSSGEAQIFVILSHLFFNPSAQRANVFIVDEPELSLHVTWQEMFVDSIQDANPQVQYILATHSPSIILDKVGNCRSTFSARRKS